MTESSTYTVPMAWQERVRERHKVHDALAVLRGYKWDDDKAQAALEEVEAYFWKCERGR